MNALNTMKLAGSAALLVLLLGGPGRAEERRELPRGANSGRPGLDAPLGEEVPLAPSYQLRLNPDGSVHVEGTGLIASRPKWRVSLDAPVPERVKALVGEMRTAFGGGWRQMVTQLPRLASSLGAEVASFVRELARKEELVLIADSAESGTWPKGEEGDLRVSKNGRPFLFDGRRWVESGPSPEAQDFLTWPAGDEGDFRKTTTGSVYVYDGLKWVRAVAAADTGMQQAGPVGPTTGLTKALDGQVAKKPVK